MFITREQKTIWSNSTLFLDRTNIVVVDVYTRTNYFLFLAMISFSYYLFIFSTTDKLTVYIEIRIDERRYILLLLLLSLRLSRSTNIVCASILSLQTRGRQDDLTSVGSGDAPSGRGRGIGWLIETGNAPRKGRGERGTEGSLAASVVVFERRQLLY